SSSAPATHGATTAQRAGALADPVLELLLLRLQPGDRNQDHLLALVHAADHLGVVPVVQPHHHAPRFRACLALDEDHCRTHVRVAGRAGAEPALPGTAGTQQAPALPHPRTVLLARVLEPGRAYPRHQLLALR